MTEPIKIKHEYEQLMCTKPEFEIKHASKTHFIMKTQPERYKSRHNPKMTNNLMVSFQFCQGINAIEFT